MPNDPPYLAPYLRAARSHGAGFSSLLWASPDTQEIRFDALCRITDLHERTILDVGCGRADLFTYLHNRSIRPAHYVGVEGVSDLADAARRNVGERGVILHADFVNEPVKMFVGAERVLISGALNTMDTPTFYATLKRAWEACAEVLAFNFLDSPLLAGVSYLTWHPLREVEGFARSLAPEVSILSDYLSGDSTIIMKKQL